MAYKNDTFYVYDILYVRLKLIYFLVFFYLFYFLFYDDKYSSHQLQYFFVDDNWINITVDNIYNRKI